MQYFDHFNVAFFLFNPTRVSDLGAYFSSLTTL